MDKSQLVYECDHDDTDDDGSAGQWSLLDDWHLLARMHIIEREYPAARGIAPVKDSMAPESRSMGYRHGH